MNTMTVEQFHEALKAQGVPRDHLAMKCPMCDTTQSAHSLIAAGAGASFEDVEKFLGFSCVGRFTGAASPRKKSDGQPCDWTLGGLFSLHKLEVVTPDGQKHPRFELATPDEANALMSANAALQPTASRSEAEAGGSAASDGWTAP